MFNQRTALEQVIVWVEEVGALQLEQFGRRDLRIESKSTGYDLVTEVDRNSERILTEKIRRAFPGHAILAEEGGGEDLPSDYLWVVDPLDGTVNFTHGFPIFGISVALQYRKQSMLGAVYFPVLKQLFHGIRGEGAYLNGERLAVAANDRLDRALLVTGFPYDKAVDSWNNLDYFSRLFPLVNGVRRTGSAAFDLCNVAAGRLDGYWEMKVNPWDIAVGTLLVEEAGGVVHYLEDHPPITLIAGNEAICGLVRREIDAVDREREKFKRGGETI